MKFFSILGTEYFYLALLPLIYWGVSRSLGLRVGALLLFSAIVNEIFKVGFAQPRPYWIDSSLLYGEPENSFGFPSGHAQNAFLIWTFLALQSRNKKLWIPLAFLLSFAVSVSRLYLGVHFPADVIGGAVIGLAILFGSRAVGPAWMKFWRQLNVGQRIFIACMATFALSGIYFIASMRANVWQPDYDSPWLKTIEYANSGRTIFPRLGAFLGFICGVILAARGVYFEARTTLPVLVPRFILGFIGLTVIYLGLGRVTKGQLETERSVMMINFIRYALVAFWVVYGAPWVWGKLKLNRSELPTTI